MMTRYPAPGRIGIDPGAGGRGLGTWVGRAAAQLVRGRSLCESTTHAELAITQTVSLTPGNSFAGVVETRSTSPVPWRPKIPLALTASMTVANVTELNRTKRGVNHGTT